MELPLLGEQEGRAEIQDFGRKKYYVFSWARVNIMKVFECLSMDYLEWTLSIISALPEQGLEL